MLLLMDKILHQLRLVVYPIIYMVLYIPGGAGFCPWITFNRLTPIFPVGMTWQSHNTTWHDMASRNQPVYLTFSSWNTRCQITDTAVKPPTIHHIIKTRAVVFTDYTNHQLQPPNLCNLNTFVHKKKHGTPVFPQLSNEKNPGWLGYIEDYNETILRILIIRDFFVAQLENIRSWALLHFANLALEIITSQQEKLRGQQRHPLLAPGAGGVPGVRYAAAQMQVRLFCGWAPFTTRNPYGCFRK